MESLRPFRGGEVALNGPELETPTETTLGNLSVLPRSVSRVLQRTNYQCLPGWNMEKQDL